MIKNRTLEELVKTPQLEDGTPVKVRIDKDTHFMGKVVGLGSSGLLPYYIVECLDNTLPNETYPYKFVSMPLSEIFTL
jgi:hypothetical protein